MNRSVFARRYNDLKSSLDDPKHNLDDEPLIRDFSDELLSEPFDDSFYDSLLTKKTVKQFIQH